MGGPLPGNEPVLEEVSLDMVESEVPPLEDWERKEWGPVDICVLLREEPCCSSTGLVKCSAAGSERGKIMTMEFTSNIYYVVSY